MVYVDPTSACPNKNTTTIYGYKNTLHMLTCIVTKVTRYLMAGSLVDSACITSTFEQCLDKSDYVFSSKKLQIKLITIKIISLFDNLVNKLKKYL